MANKRLITKLSFTHGDVLNLGDEYDNIGRIKSISFRKETHTTHGSAGMPCYVVQFTNSEVQMVIPHSRIRFVLTDKNHAPIEDGADVPELPED